MIFTEIPDLFNLKIFHNLIRKIYFI